MFAQPSAVPPINTMFWLHPPAPFSPAPFRVHICSYFPQTHSLTRFAHSRLLRRSNPSLRSTPLQPAPTRSTPLQPAPTRSPRTSPCSFVLHYKSSHYNPQTHRQTRHLRGKQLKDLVYHHSADGEGGAEAGDGRAFVELVYTCDAAEARLFDGEEGMELSFKRQINAAGVGSYALELAGNYS